MKKIILCADDYGQNAAISQAIIQLIQLKRLSATSCLTTSSLWPTQALYLKPFINQIDMGLHWNLTEGYPLSNEMKKQGFFSLQKLLIKSHLRQINKTMIKAELMAQLDRFVACMGRLPDYIDGHQHVHQFPVIRDVMLDFFDQFLRKNGSYIRSIYQPKVSCRALNFKKWILQSSGAKTLKMQLLQRNIQHNTSFSGIYKFAYANHYNAYFEQFLEEVKEGGIVMCHPGLLSFDKDTIGAARYHEYCYLKGESFLQLCKKHQIIVTRFEPLLDKVQ